MIICRMIAVAACMVFLSSLSLAVSPGEALTDPVLEKRARNISQELRCLVCQNESIDDSDAALAKDLRLIVRERLRAGDDDKEVFDFVVARYGNFVLLNPPLQTDTVLLWTAPFFVLMLSLAMAVFYLRRQSHQEDDQATQLKDN